MTTISHYMPAAEYHALDSLSSSRLKVFRQSSWMYYQRFVMDKPLPSPEPSDAMLLGTLTHDLLLCGVEDFYKNWAICPKVDRRTKEGKEKFAEFLEESAGKQVVPQDTYDAAWRIAEHVAGNETANKLLGMGMDKQWNEVAVQWHEEKHDLPCRARIDRIVTPELFIDLKTASAVDERSWANQMARLGYHNQAAWYCRAGELAFGQKPKFVFIVVQSQEPWEVALYECPEQAIELGELQNQATLERLVQCRESGEWREERSKGILTVDLPIWAYRNEWSFE